MPNLPTPSEIVAAPRRGVVMLIHPDTGDVQVLRSADEVRVSFWHLVDDGYRPLGARARAAVDQRNAQKAA